MMTDKNIVNKKNEQGLTIFDLRIKKWIRLAQKTDICKKSCGVMGKQKRE